MTETEAVTSANHSNRALWRTLVVLVLLVGYPLSVGPVEWIDYRTDWIDGPVRTTLEVFYFPLFALTETVPFVKSFYDWYIPLFWA